jgi:hypothetical protein
MLAYYVLWHALDRLDPLWARQLEEIQSGMRERKERDVTVVNVLENLQTIQRHKVRVQGASFEKTTQPNAAQREILDLLGVEI